MSRSRLKLEIAPSTRDVREAITLPPYYYTDPDFFAFERDAVFGHDWLCLGRQEEIPEAGDYFTITLNDDPLIVMRGQDGEIRVMSNVCQHRAALVAEGSGNCGRSLRCHYHWWVYDTTGQLVGAPEMQKTPGFDMTSVRLPQLKVELWQGFIFANFDHDAEPLAPHLTQLDALIENWDLAGLVTMPPNVLDHVPCNWKVMVENFIESYHSSRLHKGPHDFAPSAAAQFNPDWLDDEAAIYGWTRTTHPDGGFNPTQKALFPPIEKLTPDERQRTTFALVPPLLMLGINVDHVFWFIGLPKGPDAISLRMAYCFPRSTYDTPNFELLYEMAVAGVDVFNRDDLAANKGVQLGLHSRFAPRGRYAHQEARLAQFNRWLARRYLDEAARREAATRAGA
jgi:phenylpropionate dioxygenase-like ring-hydroxylating dioxygenase large terminal subunit